MNKMFLVLIILLMSNSIIAQKLVENYYPVSEILKDTGTLDKNGIPVGTWKYYTKEATLDYEINWDTNFIKMYYTTGELKETGTFIPETGVHISEWITYHKNGKIETKKEFDKKGVEMCNTKYHK